MTTYINQIVQITRRMHGTEGAEWKQLQDERGDVVLKAIRAGVDPDLMRWAISINDTPAKVQMQYAIAHLAAAEALEAGE